MPETETAIDHEARAERLREFLDGHASKYKHESLDEANVQPFEEEVEAEGGGPINVPHRYALATYDGDESWVQFCDDLDELAASAADLGGGDYPWSPGSAIDLDTGLMFEAALHAQLYPLTWAVDITFRGYGREVTSVGRFVSREAADNYREQMRGEDAWTIGEPEQRWQAPPVKRLVELSEEAYAMVCGLVAPSQEGDHKRGVHHAGVVGPIEEVQSAFPTDDFWKAVSDGAIEYDEEAGY